MFNLDHAIAEWRRQMTIAGIKSARVLDELESHLRDDVEERIRTGASAQTAFDAAVERLGEAAVLECEFDKVGETKEAPERMKHVLFALAGIPNHYLDETMNTPYSNIEPRWATYFKATAFLAPALLLWAMSCVFLIPKLQQICADAGGGPLPFIVRAMIGLAEHGLFISVGIILMLVLLEWRSGKWPRYRRAAVGIGAFLLNAAVLISIFMMVVTALLAAPALMHHVK
jgi:hypothetical protein